MFSYDVQRWRGKHMFCIKTYLIDTHKMSSNMYCVQELQKTAPFSAQASQSSSQTQVVGDPRPELEKS